jgi:hypothetical protein
LPFLTGFFVATWVEHLIFHSGSLALSRPSLRAVAAYVAMFIKLEFYSAGRSIAFIIHNQ